MVSKVGDIRAAEDGDGSPSRWQGGRVNKATADLCKKGALNSPREGAPGTGVFAAAEGDYACGASELSTLAMSSPGVAQLSTPSEGDDSGGLVTGAAAAAVAGASDISQWRSIQGSAAAASSSSSSPGKSAGPKAISQPGNVGAQIWRAVGGEEALNGKSGKPPDPRTMAVLKNLKSLLSSSELWQLRHGCDGSPTKQQANSTSSMSRNADLAATAADRAAGGGSPPRLLEASGIATASPNSLAVSSLSNSPSKAPNFAEAAVEALAAAKRAEASRLVVERLAEERLAAERILAERLQMEDQVAERLAAERVEGERFSAERVAAVTENERILNDRLQRCEAREVICEQQVAAEKGRAILLRSELDAARRQLEGKDREAKLADELKAREVHIAAKTQCLESMHEDARRELEALRLQNHVAEVDLGRSKSELATVNARQAVLEEELRLLKERPPKASKSGAQKRAADGKLLARYDLASRTAFVAQVSLTDEQKTKAPPATSTENGPEKSEQKQSSWLFWGCCSTTKASPSDAVNAAAPEPPSKPQPQS